MREQVRNLWKISFGDSDDFIRLWFDRVYKDEQTLVVQQNGKIVSALQILPYEMTYCGTNIPTGYICGVCTLPSERGKGYMNQLMHQSIKEMQNCGYALAVLIPATPGLFDFYRRFEFANIFDYAIEVVQSREIQKTSFSHQSKRSLAANKAWRETIRNIELRRIVSYKNLSLEMIYDYYHTKQCERDCAVIHTAYQFETICRDRILGGCEIWVALANKQPVGLAFTDQIKDKTLLIREIVYDNTDIKNIIVQSILNHHQLYSAKLHTPPTLSNSVPYGMARIIDKEQFINLYRSYHSNNPLFDLNNMNIPSLTQLFLNYERRQAYMNLMLD